MQLVDGVVRGAHRERQVGVLADERVEALAQHVAHEVGHAGDVDVGLDRQLLRQLERALGDVDARSPMRSRSVVILRPVVISRRSFAAGWCRASSLQAQLVDVDVERLTVWSRSYRASASGSSRSTQGADRLRDLVLDETTHLEDRGAELARARSSYASIRVQCHLATSAEPSRDVVFRFWHRPDW